MKTKRLFFIYIFFCLYIETFSQGTWSQKANFGGTGRFLAAGFSIGSKGYIGTGNDGSDKQDFWEWDQGTNAWTQKANFPGAARADAVGFSIGVKGYIGTGGNSVSGPFYSDFWEWDQTTNTWTQKANFGGMARFRATGFSIGTKGYIGTGWDGSYLQDFWEWDQATNTWSQRAGLPGIARWDAVGLSINNSGYIGSGYNNISLNDFWEWNQAMNAWTQKASIGGPVRSAGVGFAIGNKGYVATGNTPPALTDFWEWDQATNTWTQLQNFSGGARWDAVGFSINSCGYIGTGAFNLSGPFHNDFWEYCSCILPPQISVSGNNTICQGQNTSLSASGGATYSWNTGSSSTTITVSPTTTTSYTVIGSNSCGADTANTTVTVFASPLISISGNTSICPGDSITLTASGGTNYQWSTGNTTTSVLLSPTITSSYSVLASNANGCSGTNSVSVTVYPNPSPTISGNNTLCIGDNTTLTASGGGTYQWSNGTTGAMIIVSPTSTTSYSLTVTSADGCTAIIADTVSVFPAPTTTISGNTNFCQGQMTTLSASGGGNYVWNTGATTASINVAASGTYSVVVSIGSCSDTALTSVTVNPNPTASASSNITITQGQSVTLTASGGGTYSWTNGMAGQTIVVSPPATTIYCVTATDVNGCTDTACAEVRVEQQDCSEKPYLPNALSPNGDNENDVLKIYHSHPACIKEFMLVIYNRWGEKVFESTDMTKEWDGSFRGREMNIAVFVYYMKVTLVNGNETIIRGNVSLIR